MKKLLNPYSREDALKHLEKDTRPRITLSCYRYVHIMDPHALRDELYVEWSSMGVLGRIYLSQEGINAQLSLPEAELPEFRATMDARSEFKDIPFKIAVEDGFSFYKLTIKVKNQIVADGLAPGTYDIENVGTHLDAEAFNALLEEDDVVVVDMRNAYESRIGRFEGAICPPSDTFRDELPMVSAMLQGQKEKKIALYCTGGIRCEKASAYLKNEGFEQVHQLYGGIIQYAKDVAAKGLPSRFIGKNFVFDERGAETITDDVLTECDICKQSCDEYINCQNAMCNLLFISCKTCCAKLENTCSEMCQGITHLTPKEQQALRQKQRPTTQKIFRKRMHPETERAVFELE